MRLSARLILAGAALALAALPVIAQTTTPPPPSSPPAAAPPVDAPQGKGKGRAAMQACQADAAKLCADVPAGRGGRIACLRSNADKLSPDCAAALATIGPGRDGKQGPPPGMGPAGKGAEERGPAAKRADRQAQRAGRQACQADRQRLCGDAQPGNGGMMQCLRAKTAELSAECRSFVETIRDRGQGLRAACAADRQKLCQGEGKQARGALCLRQHQSELSPACAQALAELPVPRKGRLVGPPPAAAPPADQKPSPKL